MIKITQHLGGDQIDYTGDTTVYTVIIETICVLLNFAVSEDALIMTAKIKEFYLATPLDRTE